MIMRKEGGEIKNIKYANKKYILGTVKSNMKEHFKKGGEK